MPTTHEPLSKDQAILQQQLNELILGAVGKEQEKIKNKKTKREKKKKKERKPITLADFTINFD